ncbi:MAG TPA: NADH-quinone oxidoreductase subunit I [Phycisphaerae bacterium]|nr:NADH-quinone oxidoreductase subunit I [Phycisphaerae bacterium]
MIADDDIIIVDEMRRDLSMTERLYLPQIAQGLSVTFRRMIGTGRTIQYPEQKREPRLEEDLTDPGTQINASRYRGVHRLNRDPDGRVACVACFMCETACPAHCIHIEGGESPWPDREKYPVKFDIDELRCIYCGMCEEACPVDAIELTYEYDLVGHSRSEMVFDKNKLLDVFDNTVHVKPRKNPRITGYAGTGSPDHQPRRPTGEQH